MTLQSSLIINMWSGLPEDAPNMLDMTAQCFSKREVHAETCGYLVHKNSVDIGQYRYHVAGYVQPPSWRQGHNQGTSDEGEHEQFHNCSSPHHPIATVWVWTKQAFAVPWFLFMQAPARPWLSFPYKHFLYSSCVTIGNSALLLAVTDWNVTECTGLYFAMSLITIFHFPCSLFSGLPCSPARHEGESNYLKTCTRFHPKSAQRRRWTNVWLVDVCLDMHFGDIPSPWQGRNTRAHSLLWSPMLRDMWGWRWRSKCSICCDQRPQLYSGAGTSRDLFAKNSFLYFLTNDCCSTGSISQLWGALQRALPLELWLRCAF